MEEDVPTYEAVAVSGIKNALPAPLTDYFEGEIAK
jgi:hypothetical protein